MQAKMKVCFYTLGCKLNFSESSTLAREFVENGHQRTEEFRDADVCIINSCSVTEHADKKCRNIIRRIHKLNPEAIIAVTGCYAQLKPREIADIEGVDIVLSNNDKGDMYQKVVELGKKGLRQEVTSCTTEELTRFFAAFSSGDRTRAFLKVQDGCDYCCSYCTIHNARGASRNMPISEVVAEAERIAGEGHKEIVITGVNTGDFGRTTGESFADLLRALDNVDGIERYRISSIEPNLLTDEIISICASSKKFQPHFHIPIQSGCDRVLKEMRRRYNTAMFSQRIEAVREAMPNAFIGIDVIAGFPGETDEEAEQTYRFLERLEPAFLHVFPFSARANTPAAAMKNKVQDSVKTARAARLEELCESLHRKFYEKYIGSEANVLWESSPKAGWMVGFTENYIKVRTPFDRSKINTIERVKLLRGENMCEMLCETIK
ncbi:MAG: tRNA (N(6)-L-threonylcarbamoyladenosine(37)-C(2))-methylthiotransferase MtaB [Tidjanibacter sp.]|nr:tRNA (N(6)-L-threonylcarbamoyladenosine(37)-C(2))-methylthiotransferase MtaB [Tidjanibacter sp.]